MLQRTHYPQYLQQQQRLLSLPSTNCDSVPTNRNSAQCNTQGTQSKPPNLRIGGNFNGGPTSQQAPHQLYQSNPSYCGYQRPNKKGVYQVDDNDEFGLHLEGFYTTLNQDTKEIQYLDESFDKVDANFVAIEISCEEYKIPYFSKSQLHKHLQDGCTVLVYSSLPDPSATTPTSPISIVTLKSVISALNSSLAFQGWTYATAAIILIPQILPLDSNTNATAYFDTSCGVTFADKAWLLQQLSNQKIKEISILLKVREIGASKHKSIQFVELFFFFPGENNKGQKVYVSLKCKLYLVKGLRANIFIRNNIFAPEGFIFELKLGHFFVGSCRVKITVRARQKGQFLRKKLLAKTDSVVPPRSEAMVPLHSILFPDNKDFLFHPVVQANLTLFAHFINHKTTKVLIKNTSDRPLRISCWQRLGHAVNIHYNNCFFTEAESTL